MVYGKLLAATGNARPCGRGVIPEAGESSFGASAGPACRPLASTGRVASFSRREMAQLGDEVKSITCFAQKGEYDEGTVDA